MEYVLLERTHVNGHVMVYVFVVVIVVRPVYVLLIVTTYVPTDKPVLVCDVEEPSLHDTEYTPALP
jgi:hypothetical protein